MSEQTSPDNPPPTSFLTPSTYLQTDALSSRPSPSPSFYSMSTRLKHFFPLSKSRSLNVTPSNPTIITTAPTMPITPSHTPPHKFDGPERTSSSSIENERQVHSSASSAKSTSSSHPILQPSMNTSQTHLHVISSSVIAAAIGSNRIHFDEALSLHNSDERPSLRTPPESDSSSISSQTKFLLKLKPSQFLKGAQKRHRKTPPGPFIDPANKAKSAPSSPKLEPQPDPLSTRSSNDTTLPPLPESRVSEALPVPVETSTIENMTSLPVRTGVPPVRSRGRASTVSSVSSADAPSRMTLSRSRRASTIFSLKKDSGRGNVIEKSSFETEEELELPPSTSESGEEYLKLLQEAEGGLSKYLKKLVESS